MIIDVFTIREKINNTLIYAEGSAEENEYRSHFLLDAKWLTEEEKARPGWYQTRGQYAYREEVRHLDNYDYALVRFSMEKVEIA